MPMFMRDRSLNTRMGGRAYKKVGGASEVYPDKGEGTEKVLAMLNQNGGGTKCLG